MPTPPPDRPGSLPPAPGSHASVLQPGPRPQDDPGPPASAGPQKDPGPPASPGPQKDPGPHASPRPGGGRRPSRRECPRTPAEPRPLPDPAAVRLCLIPDSAPPYDVEVAPTRRTTGRADAGQRDTTPGPREVPAHPEPPGQPDHPVRTGRAPATEAAWPSHFAQVLAETLAGSRPARQMAPWTTERARNRIQRLGPQLSGGQHPTVRRVLTFQPTPDVIEMTVVVGFGPRVRAVAVRLERANCAPGSPGGDMRSPGGGIRPARWLCTTVEAA
jgi:hypothetical protein